MTILVVARSRTKEIREITKSPLILKPTCFATPFPTKNDTKSNPFTFNRCPVNQSEKLQMNLNVLKRLDKNIVAILDTSSHVVVYDFCDNKWSKRGIEGSLFIYQRSCTPYYAFIIMNRLSMENLTVDLLQGLEISKQGDYVIFKDADDEITGLWMYEADDRARISLKIIELTSRQPRDLNDTTMHRSPTNTPVKTRKNEQLKGKTLQPSRQGPLSKIPVQQQLQSPRIASPVTSNKKGQPRDIYMANPSNHTVNSVDIMGLIQKATLQAQQQPINNAFSPPRQQSMHSTTLSPQQRSPLMTNGPSAQMMQPPIDRLDDIFDRLDLCFIPNYGSRNLSPQDFHQRLNVMTTDASFIELLYHKYKESA